MSLTGKIAFIAGATGIVGSGIATSLLKQGAKVWIASRDEQKLKEFKHGLPEDIRDRLEYVRGEVGNENDCIRIRDHILKHDKKINHVVSSLGGWWQKGTLSDQSLEEFNKIYGDMVTSHFIVYKTFAKELAKEPGSTYTFITGGSGEQSERGEIFLPTASLINVGSSSVYGLYNAAKSEFHQHKNLKVSQLRIFLWVKKQEDKTYDSAKATHEVGNDFIGKFLVKITSKHLGGLYKVESRAEATKVYESM